MKFDHKHGFIGSVIAFIIGTSCCWLTSLAIWLGGATVLSTLAVTIEDKQTMILTVALVFAVISGLLYWKKRKKSSDR